MKNYAVFIVAVLALLVMMAAAGAQEEMAFVDNSDFTNPQRPPSVFPHE